MAAKAGVIRFARGVSWTAVSDDHLMMLASPPSRSRLADRVLFAALARLDPTQHARFGKGELTRILGTVDVATGEIVPARSDSVSHAIRTLKMERSISDDSSARCIVLAHTFAQTGVGARSRCAIHC